MTFQIFGHRGTKGTEPENTLRSFRSALELGVSGLEFDVQRSKDGELVVIHDRTLGRTTSGKGRVCDQTLSELQTLDAGKGERIPTLAELFDFAAGRTLLQVEIKALGIAGQVAALIERTVAQGRARYDQFIVSSFNHRELFELRKLQPQIPLGALLLGMPVDLASVTAPLAAYSVHISVDYLDRNFVDEAHGLGLKVFVYTVNSPEDFEAVQSSGADGIFSDYPERFLGPRHA